ncbi:hypothetical protein IFO70_06585 [Phormidium tenue FACHB-886]|nr:hypothetical protein [Phormidium tenue FACHB-886]
MQTEVQTQTAPTPSSVSPNNGDTAIAILAVALPIILIASVISYRRFRSARLRRQIESLEKIWQLSYRKTKS